MPTPLPIGASSQHSQRPIDSWRRWSPYALILTCIFTGWAHAKFSIPPEPPAEVSKTNQAPDESTDNAYRAALKRANTRTLIQTRIQEGANFALLIVACAAWIHRRRLAALQWVILESGSLVSLVIAGELALALWFLYGGLSLMGMPGLFWHYRRGYQFVTGIGVTLFAFWMLYLLFVIYEQNNPAHSGRSFWSRYDDRWPGGRPAVENPDSLDRFFWRFGSLTVLVLVLPASFPWMRGWDHYRRVEWPWLIGVFGGTFVVALVVRTRLLAHLHGAIVRAARSLLLPLQLLFVRGDQRPSHLTKSGALGVNVAETTDRGNPLLLVAILYGLSYIDQGANLGLLKHVMPAGVSLCVLLAAVASFLVWLQGRSTITRIVVVAGLLGLITLTGSRDYKSLSRDLQELKLYPEWREQYAMLFRNLMKGRADTREKRADVQRNLDGKPEQGQPATYQNVIDLALLQERQFEPVEFKSAVENAKDERKKWLTRWKNGLSDSPSDKPVLVVVCTSGGALRAALWTEVVLDSLAGSLPGFEDRVRLITGASGGMLGAARFVVSMKEKQPMPALTNPNPPDYLEEIARQIALRDIIPDMFLPWSTKNRGDVLEDGFGNYEIPAKGHAAEAGGGGGGGGKRGGGINTTFAQLLDGERDGKYPSIIFSPMIAEDGRRLLISNQPLADLVAHGDGFPLVSEDEEELVRLRPDLGRQGNPKQAALELPRVASTPAIEFFSMFGAKSEEVRKHFRLGSAVRMSATFPYVTPSVVLPTDPPRHVVDAGYYDNYGVNLAARWIAANADWIQENAGGVLVVQIRAFRNEKRLKLYDPDANYQTPSPVDDDAHKPSSSLFPSLNIAQVLTAGLQEWFVPLQGAAAAQDRSMYFRNDEQLLALHEYFQATGKTPTVRNDFLRTVIFTCDSTAPGDSKSLSPTLNWYMTREEFHSIKANMRPLSESDYGRDRNHLRMEKLKAWWEDRIQGN